LRGSLEESKKQKQIEWDFSDPVYDKNIKFEQQASSSESDSGDT